MSSPMEYIVRSPSMEYMEENDMPSTSMYEEESNPLEQTSQSSSHVNAGIGTPGRFALFILLTFSKEISLLLKSNIHSIDKAQNIFEANQ